MDIPQFPHDKTKVLSKHQQKKPTLINCNNPDETSVSSASSPERESAKRWPSKSTLAVLTHPIHTT